MTATSGRAAHSVVAAAVPATPAPTMTAAPCGGIGEVMGVCVGRGAPLTAGPRRLAPALGAQHRKKNAKLRESSATKTTPKNALSPHASTPMAAATAPRPWPMPTTDESVADSTPTTSARSLPRGRRALLDTAVRWVEVAKPAPLRTPDNVTHDSVVVCVEERDNGALARVCARVGRHQTRREPRARWRSLPCPHPHPPSPQPHDDLLAPNRRLAVVSTATPPWLTGTAVNPALRAAFLAAAVPASSTVTLVVPWLPPTDQAELFPGGASFATPADHEAALRSWVEERAGVAPTFRVLFYAARYDRTLLGVFPVGDLVARVAGATRPHAVILEEPEHLTWHHAGARWTTCAQHVVGVVHTNYRELGGRNAGPVMAWVAGAITHWLVAAHCNVVVKLSDAIQPLPRSVTECVHGVAPAFLERGVRESSGDASTTTPAFTHGAYALGKVVFGKGWEELVALLADAAATLPPSTRVSAYGDGAALPSVKETAAATGAPIDFRPRLDHLDGGLKKYRAFVNASTSDVVATTSLEALAMGKWLVCADHPCNAFAARFGNALVYRSPTEFGACLARALTEDPAALPPAEATALTWPAATLRLATAAKLSSVQGGGGGDGDTKHRTNTRPRRRAAVAAAEAAFAKGYATLLAVEPLRVAVGAGARTKHAPADGLTYTLPQGRAPRGATHDGAGGTRLGTALVALVASRPGGRVSLGGWGTVEWGARPDVWDGRWRGA